MSLAGVLLLVAGITALLFALIWLSVCLAGYARRTLDPATRSKHGTFQTLLWPELRAASDARLTSRQIGKLSLLISGVYAFLVSVGRVEIGALADSLVFCVIGAGLLKCSRVAAVAGLAAYLGEQVWAISAGRIPSPISLIYLLAFFSGVRAAFSYHRMQPSHDEKAST